MVNVMLLLICLCKTAFQQGGPQHVPMPGLFLPRGRTLHAPWLSLRRFLMAHSSSLSRSLWMDTRPSGFSATPPSLLLPAQLLRVPCHSVSSRDEGVWGHHE